MQSLLKFQRVQCQLLFQELCHVICIHLLHLVILKLIPSKIAKISAEFEDLHGISCILRAIDCNHIPIVAPKIDSKSYYRPKGFYLGLI